MAASELFLGDKENTNLNDAKLDWPNSPVVWSTAYEPHLEKTYLWRLQQGKAQTGILSYRD